MVLFQRNKQIHESDLEVQEIVGQRLHHEKNHHQFHAKESLYLARVVVELVKPLEDFEFMPEEEN